jgi:formimidoylglutamate deiminase
MGRIRAGTALLPGGWAQDVTVTLAAGRIAAVLPAGAAGAAAGGAAGDAERCDILLPAPVNLHSHSFQRAMAGLTEARGPAGADSFWTWRQAMFRFLDRLSPDDIAAIAAQAFVEMLEAGFAAVAEFHYLHHAPGGVPYADPAETSGRIVAAAAETGIGLCLLPVLYEQGGCDGRPLGPGQLRFGCTPEAFAALLEAAARHLPAAGPDAGLGVAPHSLRAVRPASVGFAAGLRPGAPVHIHAAEQIAEVRQVAAALGARPVEWLLHEAGADARWCLIHCTRMRPAETLALARSGAVAGLCPVTESSLGDGIFGGVAYARAGGRFGFGTDSNIRIGLAEELRSLELSQRLRHRGRAMLAEPARSTGRVLWEAALAGGAQAAQRPGGIAVGAWADLVALDADAGDLPGKAGDGILDALVFARGEGAVRHVWSAGRAVVRNGSHIARDPVRARFRAVLARLAT